MLLSPEGLEFAKHINDQPCEICHTSHAPGRHVTLDEMQQNYIKKVFDDLGGKKLETARVLGIDINTLKSRLGRLS